MSVIADLPDLRPSLLLDFANSGRVDPRINFARAAAASRWNAAGLQESVAAGVPRIDHDPATGRCLGLYVEEARTNLFTYSANVTNAVWGKANLTADGSKVLVGGADFYKVSEVVTAQPIGKNVRRMFPSAYPAGTALSIKWFFIEGTRRFCNVVILSAGATASIALDTKTGDFSIRQTGLPGWTWTVVKHLTGVIEVVAKNPSIHAEYPTGAYIDMRPTTVASLAEAGSIGDAYTGDTSQYVYIGPIQLELGASPTSYIPTDAAAVTRAAENAYIDVSPDWYNPAGGTLFVEAIAPNSIQTFARLASLEKSGSVNVLSIQRVQDAASSTARGYFEGASIVAGATSFPPSVPVKVALAGALGDFALSASGSIFTSSLGAFGASTQLRLGSSIFNSSHLNGHIQRVAYYPRRLTNAQLQRLTA